MYAIMKAKKRYLLKADELKRLLEEDGFVRVPFISADGVQQLRDLFDKFYEGSVQPVIFNTLEGAEADKRKQIHHEIVSICQQSLDRYLENYKVIIAMYFNKKPGEHGTVGIHNDPSMTYEEYHHLGVWIPLVNSDEKNGAMNFVRGSHHFFRPYFAKTISTPYCNVEPLLDAAMECIPVKAGEALIFDNNAIHCTRLNLSDKPRMAVIIKVVDKDAPCISLFRNPLQNEGRIEIIAQEDDYYLSAQWQDTMERPKAGKHAGFLDYDSRAVSAMEMQALLNKRNPAKSAGKNGALKSQPGLFKRIAELFS
jgi:hypothetical protein